MKFFKKYRERIELLEHENELLFLKIKAIESSLGWRLKPRLQSLVIKEGRPHDYYEELTAKYRRSKDGGYYVPKKLRKALDAL